MYSFILGFFSDLVEVTLAPYFENPAMMALWVPELPEMKASANFCLLIGSVGNLLISVLYLCRSVSVKLVLCEHLKDTITLLWWVPTTTVRLCITSMYSYELLSNQSLVIMDWWYIREGQPWLPAMNHGSCISTPPLYLYSAVLKVCISYHDMQQLKYFIKKG